MPSKHLSAYLLDHAAGAEAALEIMDHIESSHGNTRAGSAVREVRPQIEEDRDTLQSLIEQLTDSSSVPRRVLGWIGEKALELKIKLDDPADGALRLLESLEILTLGIEGKIALWRSLEANVDKDSAIAKLDYVLLVSRAQNQRTILEPARIEAARHAFARDTPKS